MVVLESCVYLVYLQNVVSVVVALMKMSQTLGSLRTKMFYDEPFPNFTSTLPSTIEHEFTAVQLHSEPKSQLLFQSAQSQTQSQPLNQSPGYSPARR